MVKELSILAFRVHLEFILNLNSLVYVTDTSNDSIQVFIPLSY